MKRAEDGPQPNEMFREKEVRLIRSMYYRGATRNQLAVMFGVDRSTIGQMVHGTTYKWAGGPVLESSHGNYKDKKWVWPHRQHGRE